ncbi:type III secretion T3S chaperone [Criblamydia sequanensis]|uniref:Type III secretion T3S chaperone n=1 Tax=Candidatus Criblamydia sequanensis CRIB-18 TaxID=1437425 RepID=A0A090CZQ2_9BACT|nr:type III secretion T3S chaperone [Criblamydia sequanensis]CDR32945.1 conserved hypothetical protein [Criblamydia sequanensis CRIB-18]
MMKMPIYPLIQVVEVKKRRVENQEKVVKLKQDALDQELKRLKEREAERDKVLNHYNDKLEQLRAEFDHGTTSEKIIQMKVYLKEVKERLKVEEKKVKEQKEQVEVARKDLEQAQKELKKRRLDVDKLNTHREDWEKEMMKEIEIKEAVELDEMGTVIFLKQMRESKE